MEWAKHVRTWIESLILLSFHTFLIRNLTIVKNATVSLCVCWFQLVLETFSGSTLNIQLTLQRSWFWWFFAPGGTPMELVRVECEHIALTRLNCTASRLIWTFINPVFAVRWILQCCQHILCSQAYVFNAVSVDGYRLRWNLR